MIISKPVSLNDTEDIQICSLPHQMLVKKSLDVLYSILFIHSMSCEIICVDGAVRNTDQQSFQIQIHVLNVSHFTRIIATMCCISEAILVPFISQVIHSKRKRNTL